MSKIEVCPECNESKVQPQSGAEWSNTPNTNYYCAACGAHFDEPKTRMPNGHTNGGSELSSKLRKMDTVVKYD